MLEALALDYISELPPEAAFHFGVLFTLAFEEKVRKVLGLYRERKQSSD